MVKEGVLFKWHNLRSETTSNYQVIVERYPFLNEVVDGSIPTVKSFLYLTGEKLSR